MDSINRRILRTKQVIEITGYSRAQVWRKSRDPDDDFPTPVQLGESAVGFYSDEIEAWLASRPRVTRGS